MEQKQYASESLYDVWKNNGSGYAWWDYEDYGINNSWSGRWWGVITAGALPNVREKPVAQVFKEFIPPPKTLCEKPDNYYDPFNHEINTTAPVQNWVIGHVYDTDGNPINDAFVQGVTCIYDYIDLSGELQKLYDVHYTYSGDIDNTGENGKFRIIPHNWDMINPPALNTIYKLMISAPGCSRKYYGHQIDETDDISFIVTNAMVEPVLLDKVNLGFDETVSGAIFPGMPCIYRSSNKLTLKNFTIHTGTTCEGVARNEINLNQEFFAENGSEDWFYLGPVLFPCEELAAFPEKSANLVENSVKENNGLSEEIELNFLEKGGDFDINIYPNPGDGLYTIEILTTIRNENYICQIFSQYGNLLETLKQNMVSFSLNLSKYTTGVYVILIQDSKNCVVKKVVKY